MNSTYADWGIAPRVARGVAVLDRHDPDWWRPDVEGAISVTRLRMEDLRLCLLGQRYGSLARPVNTDPYRRTSPYRTGLRVLGLRQDQAAAHGFTGVDAELLTPYWQQVIVRRRADIRPSALGAVPGVPARARHAVRKAGRGADARPGRRAGWSSDSNFLLVGDVTRGGPGYAAACPGPPVDRPSCQPG